MFRDLELCLFPCQLARCEEALEDYAVLTWKEPGALNYLVEEASPPTHTQGSALLQTGSRLWSEWKINLYHVKALRSGGYLLCQIAITANTSLFPSFCFMAFVYYIFLLFPFPFCNIFEFSHFLHDLQSIHFAFNSTLSIFKHFWTNIPKLALL